MCTKFYDTEIALLYTKCFDSFIIPCIMNDISKGAAGDHPAALLLFRDISLGQGSPGPHCRIRAPFLFVSRNGSFDLRGRLTRAGKRVTWQVI